MNNSNRNPHNHNHNTHSHNHDIPKQDRLAYAYECLKTGQPYIVEHKGHDHDHNHLESIRKFDYKGHSIVIRTQYTVTIDNQIINGHFEVDNNGRLSTHILPNYVFNSAVDMLKTIIDCMPSGENKIKE